MKPGVPAREASRDLTPSGAQLPLQRDQPLVVLEGPGELLLGLVQVVGPALAALLAAALLDLEVLAHQTGDERPILVSAPADELSQDVVFLNERTLTYSLHLLYR